jgi:3-hydroxyisobutyrate dehydrogenase-like beta-hydroxyacid dehydrogenase
MDGNRIGFIGFGEVARTFAAAMRERGAQISYADVVEKQAPAGIARLSLGELVGTCDLVLSTAATHVAVAIAESAAPFLTPRTVYADMNSTSAAVKRRIAAIVGGKASFVEGAILSAIGEAGARARILVAGEQAEAFARRMNDLGLVNVQYFSPRVGEASQVKMLRSIFSKGVECLLLEMLVAGRRAGLAEPLWADIVDFMTRHPFQGVAENWVRTHPGACERRFHEMEQVLETLADLGVEPVMTRGTTEFFRRSTAAGLARAFPGKPESVWDVAERLESLRGSTGADAEPAG